jgi:hypothetical protein
VRLVGPRAGLDIVLARIVGSHLLFCGLFYDAISIQNGGMINKLGRMGKQAIVASLRNYPGISLEGMTKTTNKSQIEYPV